MGGNSQKFEERQGGTRRMSLLLTMRSAKSHKITFQVSGIMIKNKKSIEVY